MKVVSWYAISVAWLCVNLKVS
uniref:Uncharacterized protein n=1 Tax=Anguilla anguilla TaxID=7936 RepID=A0A0E9RLL4_ANGAN